MNFRGSNQLLRQEFRPMRGLKVNFTDVRISAMEDFVGRGDRRLAPVIQRAWELGAGMDAWWESLDRAFGAWTQAIDEAGLTLKYRRVEQGEWNLFEEADRSQSPSTVGHQAAEQAVGDATSLPSDLPSDTAPHRTLDRPLPWDHLDTGIDKTWLKEDLQRALAAATVPDCSFDGCSHCGVCGVEFGHNIVVPPLPIPAFAGHFVPNQTRAQRLRVWLGKQGEMALVSHLDLLRLFDRAVRRAAVPIAFTGGFHPGPRIVPANALSLGITSSGEIVDFELTEPMEPEIFREKLAAQLPTEMPIYAVESVDVNGKAAAALLEQAEYLVTIALDELPNELPDKSPVDWPSWVATLIAASEIWVDQTTKSGKVQSVNLRDRLSHLQLESIPEATPDATVTLRYIGSCRNDGTLLRPDHLVQMLEQVSDRPLHLVHTHRERLILGTDSPN